MRVRVLGEGFYASVYARNMAHFGHEYSRSESDPVDVTVIAHERAEDSQLTSVMLGEVPSIIVTPLPFHNAGRLKPWVAYVPENLSRWHPDQALRSQPAGIVGRESVQFDGTYGRFLGSIYPVLFWSTPRVAALYKHMLSSYIATCLQLGNEWETAAKVLGITEPTGPALHCLLQDHRVSQDAPLKPGPFDGSHVLRDVLEFPQMEGTLLGRLRDLLRCEVGA